MRPKNNAIHVCVPTQEELNGIAKYVDQSPHNFEWHITGLGCFTTAYHLAKEIFSNEINQLIHVGIAGSYDKSKNLGQVVEVRTERMIDFGAELGDGTKISFHEIVPSVHSETYPWKGDLLINPTKPLSLDIDQVHGLTVPFASGTISTVAQRIDHGATVESMEGAGLFYTCLQEQVSFHSIRGISNYVDVRDRASWKIDLALANVANALMQLNLD